MIAFINTHDENQKSKHVHSFSHCIQVQGVQSNLKAITAAEWLRAKIDERKKMHYPVRN